MKLPLPLHPLRKLAVFLCLLAFSCGQGRAQAPISQQLDVFFGETKLLTVDRPVDSFSVTDNNIIKVSQVEGSPSQLSIVGMAGGNSALTIKSDGRTLLYDIAVSAAPERLYINLNESKRLTFANPIDDTRMSDSGVVTIVQPDTSDRVLLVEANGTQAGKATLTVYSKGEIYRYFISTFENRGADVLEIQNAFSAKGYRNLVITFNKDQATITGTVPTQEELDDAVRIVKQYTQFVVIKAQLGQEMEQSEYTEEESIIINNIQRIANVKGLTVRVKFPAPTVVTTSTYTKSTGDYVAPTVTTTPQGGTVRGSGFEPPKDPNQQNTETRGNLEPPPQQNTTETTTTSKNTSIPEKIFLYGDLEDDLQEAKVIRVARTFCPFIVNFMTVRDPIQIRTQIRFMQVSNSGLRTTGVDWAGSGNGPTIALGFGSASLLSPSASPFNLLPNPFNAFKNFITSPTGVGATVNATAILGLYEKLGQVRQLRQSELLLTDGQPGWYSEGEVRSYVSSIGTTAIGTGNTTVTSPTTSQIFLGVNMDISPLNLVKAGGVEAAGQKILAIPSSIGATGSGYTVETDSSATPDKVGKVGVIQRSGAGAPEVDNTVKYVDENGLIGMNISTQLTLPSSFVAVPFEGGSITLPDVFVRTTRTRVSLRDGQMVAIDGLIDKEISKTISQVPFFANLPLFSALFKGHNDTTNDEEVLVLVTPHLVRMRDPNSARYPKPVYPEMQDLARAYGDIPIIKPVRYDARAVDIRPTSPKDLKDGGTGNATIEPAPAEPAPLAPRASGGMRTLQPPPDYPPAPADLTPPVDNAATPTDNSRQPNKAPAPLAPTSTLP